MYNCWASPPSLVPVIHDSSPQFPTFNIVGQLVGSRLRLFSKEWRLVTNDPWVLQIVDTGFHIDFISSSFQSTDPGECTMGPQMEAVCDKKSGRHTQKKGNLSSPRHPGIR
jgi:hypothetical protein